MEWDFSGQIIEWRGPAPFLFLVLPQEVADDIRFISSKVTYGWGAIPVYATIGNTEYKTSLFPKNGTYYLPLKVSVQKAEGLELGQVREARIEINFQP
jgi:hypothetical protein